MRRLLVALSLAAFLPAVGLPATAVGQSTSAGTLRVGAAKVDITPAAGDLPAQYTGVLDPVYSRAIVADNGTAAVVFVTVDSLSLSDAISERLGSRISAETGIPADHVVLTGTGTHSVPARMRDTANPSQADLAWETAIIRSVATAKARLQPARMTYGSGRSWINVQRDRIDPATGRWWEGPNYDGVSDKEVAVMSFVSETGEPIAVYYNYGVFNVITGMQDMVSGDVTGASSKYIEDATGPDFVAALALGPHGDQNPIFFNQTFELRDLRIADYATRGEDIRIAMPPPGGVGLDRSDPRVARLMDQQRQVNSALGLMLGEEVLRVMRDSPEGDAAVSLYTAQTSVSCPGRLAPTRDAAGWRGPTKTPNQSRSGLA